MKEIKIGDSVKLKKLPHIKGLVVDTDNRNEKMVKVQWLYPYTSRELESCFWNELILIE